MAAKVMPVTAATAKAIFRISQSFLSISIPHAVNLRREAIRYGDFLERLSPSAGRYPGRVLPAATSR
jgi:hypothetical protein